jgi:hypothetical protein
MPLRLQWHFGLLAAGDVVNLAGLTLVIVNDVLAVKQPADVAIGPNNNEPLQRK